MSKSVACRVDNTLLAPGDKLRKKIRFGYATQTMLVPFPFPYAQLLGWMLLMLVTEGFVEAQRGVLEFCSSLAREFWAHSFWVPNVAKLKCIQTRSKMQKAQ